MNEALRDWVTNVADTFYCIGTAAGPHPYPAMVRDFQCVIGDETRAQMHGAGGPPARQPRRLRSAAARTPSASSIPSSTTPSVEMFGVEAAGHGLDGPQRPRRLALRRAARRAARQPHLSPAWTTTARSSRATRSRPASTIPASGRSMPGCNDVGRVTYLSATDKEALAAFQLCSTARGHHPGARARPCARQGDRARAEAAEGPSDGDEHVRPRRQGHLRRRRASGRDVRPAAGREALRKLPVTP